MPSKVYDNAWLRAREQPAREFTRDIMHTPEEQARRKALVDGSGDPLGEAQQFLASNRLDPVNVQDVAETDRRIGANRSRRDAALAAPGATRPWSMQDVTQGLASTGEGMQWAALPAAALGPAPSAALMALGEILQAPENIRGGIENPNEGMGVGEGALRAGALMLGRGAGKRPTGGTLSRPPVARPEGPSTLRPSVTIPGRPSLPPGNDAWSNLPLGKAAAAGEPARVVPEVSRQSASFGPTANPNQMLAVAREIAAETGQPLETVLAGGRKAGVGRPQAEALAKLAGSGIVGRTTRHAAESPIPNFGALGQGSARPLSWAEQSSAAGRTVNPGSAPPLEGLYGMLQQMMQREAKGGMQLAEKGAAGNSLRDLVRGGSR